MKKRAMGNARPGTFFQELIFPGIFFSGDVYFQGLFFLGPVFGDFFPGDVFFGGTFLSMEFFSRIPDSNISILVFPKNISSLVMEKNNSRDTTWRITRVSIIRLSIIQVDSQKFDPKVIVHQSRASCSAGPMLGRHIRFYCYAEGATVL